MQLVDIAFQRPEIDEKGLVDAFQAALNSEMNEDEKLIFAQRKLEFLEDFSMDPFKIQDAFDEYYKYAKNLGATTKKRQLDGVVDEMTPKKLKGEVNGSGENEPLLSLAGNVNPAGAVASTTTSPTATSATATTMSAQDASAAAYGYAQSWANYPQYANYQQAWGTYPASYYPSH